MGTKYVGYIKRRKQGKANNFVQYDAKINSAKDNRCGETYVFRKINIILPNDIMLKHHGFTNDRKLK